MKKPQPLFKRIKAALSMAAQVIIAAPLKLPPKVLAGARYVALLIGLLDALDAGKQAKPPASEEDADG